MHALPICVCIWIYVSILLACAYRFPCMSMFVYSMCICASISALFEWTCLCLYGKDFQKWLWMSIFWGWPIWDTFNGPWFSKGCVSEGIFWKLGLFKVSQVGHSKMKAPKITNHIWKSWPCFRHIHMSLVINPYGGVGRKRGVFLHVYISMCPYVRVNYILFCPSQ